MFVLFNTKGKLREDVLFFRKSKVLPNTNAGDLYDRFGDLLIRGTFLHFEIRRRKETIILVSK